MEYIFILILFGLCINIEVVKCTSVCSFNGNAAFCINRGLHQVPLLPMHVNYVDLSLNSIAELNETSFFNVEGLQVLMLMQQTPGLVIRNNTFRRHSNLILLKLEYNHFLQLETGAFNGLSSLEILTLTQCSLDGSVLSGDVLKPLVSLEMLILRENNIQRIQPASFFMNMRRFHVLDLSFNKVKSICEEDLLSFQGKHFTLLQLASMTPIEDVTCASPEDQYMVPVVRSSIQCEDKEDESSAEKLRLVLFIFCSALIISLTASAIIYVRRRGYIFKLYKKLIGNLVDGKQQEPNPDRFLYDVYLCFSSSDFNWVERALLQRLDSQFSEQNTLRCCFEERDFIPGEDHISNMRNAIQNSQKTLCVVSERFLRDGWCLETFSLAQKRMQVELKDILLVLVVGNIPQYRLMKYKQVRSYIENRRYLTWPDDSQDLEWFYDQLLQKIKKNTKVKQTNQPTEQTKDDANVQANTAV